MKTYKTGIGECYQCKLEKGVYVMKDKVLTKNKFKAFCKECYFFLFKKEK